MFALSAAGNAAALSTRCWQNTGHRAGAALNAGRSRLRGLAPRRLRASRRPLRGVYAIGFDLPGSPDVKGVEKQAEGLVNAAASLLVFQPVLKGRPAQAFLKVLLQLQGGTPRSLQESYGEFYSELASKGYGSWREYLLRQLLWGKFCLYAQQAAAGTLPTSPDAPLHQAAAHDLDVLQRLCLAESTLAAWARDSSPGVSDAWMQAASSLPTAPRQPHSEDGSSTNGASREPLGICGAPCSPQQLQSAADALASQERWSDGLAELRAHYETYGAGLLGHHWVLRWDTDHLAELHPAEAPGSAWVAPAGAAALMGWQQPQLPPAGDALAVSFEEAEAEALAANTARHLRGGGAQHCLLRGPAGAGTSALLWAPIADAAKDGLRVIQLPASSRQLSHASLEQLCRVLAKHHRMRFVVVVENLQVRMGSEEHTGLVTHLSGMGGNMWPDNVRLYASTPVTGPMLPGASDGGVLEGCFGLALLTGSYNEAGMSI